MTNWNDVKPTSGDVANSYEYMIDIRALADPENEWINVPDITALNPQFTAQLANITTYAHKGATAQAKTGSDLSLDFNILKVRDETGEFQPEWLILKTAADAKGEANVIEVRWYDALGASDAYQGKVSVARSARPNTGNNEPGFDAFTLTGFGEVLPIPNPTAGSGD